jgi:catechol 2,3-dioxygenase-like lactoylglutathione lyase family enzyme
MPELRQLVIAAQDPNRLLAFYETVFELEKIDEGNNAVVLSDGVFNLALVAAVSSEKAGLRNMSFDTVRVESMRKKLSYMDLPVSNMTEIGNSPVGIEYELRDPDGNRVGICRRAFDVGYEKRPVPIRHIALYTPEPRRMAEFYCKVFDMKEVDKTDRSSIFVSDGYCNLALLYQREEEAIGLNHFGFHVRSNEEMQARAAKAGGFRGAARPSRIPFAEYRVRDPEGNGIDISQKGWRV